MRVYGVSSISAYYTVLYYKSRHIQREQQLCQWLHFLVKNITHEVNGDFQLY